MSFVMTCQKYYNNKYIICGMVFVLMVQIALHPALTPLNDQNKCACK